MIFRASMAGGCTRQMVSSILNPGEGAPTLEKLPFLSMGHDFQAAAIRFIHENSDHRIVGVEAEGLYSTEKFEVRGHVDGVVVNSRSTLLEVKAIKASNWEKLAAADDWRDVYGHYVPSAQVYMGMKDLSLYDRGSTDHWEGPHQQTYFFFINRDTSQMLGGLKIDHPAYIHRKDMVEKYSVKKFKEVMARYSEAAELAAKEEMPEHCDKAGWCFFCQLFGAGTPSKAKDLVIYIDAVDPDYESLVADAIEYEQIKVDEKRKTVLRESLLAATAEIDANASRFDIDFGKEGTVRLSISEVRRSTADKDQVKQLVAAGKIPQVSVEYSVLRQTRVPLDAPGKL